MKRLAVLMVLLVVAIPAVADAEHATLVRAANLYLSPDASSNKLAEVERGRDLVILENSRNWLHVMATLGTVQVDEADDYGPSGEKTITGWILDKGLVRVTTPNGDRILFGEAADSEDQGSRRGGRRGAAQDAGRLYYRVYELFPASPLAGEALYRAADIRWQIDKQDVNSRPSARNRESYLREGINEEWMKLVVKKFSGTRWADLAAFNLIDNKLCGDWQGSSKCPEKEAEMYEKYARERPQSPKAPESLYAAAWRRAALVEIYKTEQQAKKSDDAKSRALALAQQIASQFPQSDYAPRAQALAFQIQQNVPVWGNAVE